MVVTFNMMAPRRNFMKKLLFLPVLMHFFSSVQALANSPVTCDLIYERKYANEEKNIIHQESGVFINETDVHLDMRVEHHGHIQGSISRDPVNNQLKMNLGDFCGEQFLEVYISEELPIYGKFSYGRRDKFNAEVDGWSTLTLSCRR